MTKVGGTELRLHLHRFQACADFREQYIQPGSATKHSFLETAGVWHLRATVYIRALRLLEPRRPDGDVEWQPGEALMCIWVL